MSNGYTVGLLLVPDEWLGAERFLDVLAVKDSRDPTAAPQHVRDGATRLSREYLDTIQDSTLAGLRIGVPQVR